MKVKIFTIFLIAANLSVMPVFGIFGAEAGGGSETAADYEKNQILVKYRDFSKPVKVNLAPDEDPEEAVNEYEKNPAVEYAELNYQYRAAIIPSDSYYGEQWYLKKIKAQEAWDIERESPDVVIAIIDSGVDINHPDLKDNVWANKSEIPGNGIDDDHDGYIDDVNGWDFVNNTADPKPKFMPGFTEDGVNHGTIVAGIAAAAGNNAAGIAGVSWRSKIMPLKVLGDSGEGNTLNVIRAIDYAISHGANILNFSFVGFGYSQGLEAAIGRAHNAGMLIVAAAGNESGDGQGYFLDSTPMYPVCHDGPDGENWIIGVAATDSLDQKSKFSSYGFKCVDIAAPGESIFSTVVYDPSQSVDGQAFNKYYDGYWSGTSVAAPQVSGALALMEQANFSLTVKEIENLLLNNTDNISRVNQNFLGQLGRGRLNILNPLEAAVSGLNSFAGRIMTAPLKNALPIINISDQDGGKVRSFPVFDSGFNGGVSLAAGDIDGDGTDEIIAGAGPGGGPHVRIFSAAGELKGQFFAYGDKFRGGVSVAAGDIDGDGTDEIITGAGPGGGPQVRIFGAGGKVKGQFFAYDSAFRGGVRVAAGNVYDLSREIADQIITAPGAGIASQIRIFNNSLKMIGGFTAYTANFRGGASLAIGDINNDGIGEIITGAGPGGAPHVRSFTSQGRLIGSYYGLGADFTDGINAGYVRINK